MTRTRRSPRLAPLAGAICIAVISASVAGAEPARREREPAPMVASAPALTYMASRGRPEGIDVSNWQGRILWWKVARDGVDFAIAKASEGNGHRDASYPRNHARAAVRGLYVTAYHYARPDRSRRDAIHEADFFVRRARLRPRDLVPALDLEDSGGLRRTALRRWTLTWLQRVEQRLGVKPMVYTSPGFWTSYMGDTRRIARLGYRVVWVAHWGTFRPRVPAGTWAGHGWTFWQWTSHGHVDGVRGNVDRNWYNGQSLRPMTIREHRQAARD